MNEATIQKRAQRIKILEYIMEHGEITSMDAQMKLHIVDGRKRISELRRLGYNIADEWVHGKNAEGTMVRYKRYYLEDD